MVPVLVWSALAAFGSTVLSASTPGRSQPSRHQQSSQPTIDLGYEIYQGSYNATTGLNTFLGMRYAQDTSGANRWQPPKAPLQNRASVIPAVAFPNRCPQGPSAPFDASSNFTGTEDCLFLSVFAPANKTNLPVYVYIHGGGYGQGQGDADLTEIMAVSNNEFIAVVIQYRLAVFGFLSSDEVSRFGTPNAGILDQHFSLEWVQKYISQFGGDPTRVTISGQSAGGGSVMLQVMAYGGTDGTKYFQQAIAQSPFLPFQYDYNAFEPTQSYYAFATAVGCFNGEPYGNTSGTVFDCLVSKPSNVLQEAGARISGSGNYGTWAFLPVTDGSLLIDLPSQQLKEGKVNGARILSGNNADEGPEFVPNGISTEDDFVSYVREVMPLLDNQTVNELLKYYPASNVSGEPEYATIGTGGPGATALDVSQFAEGQQQRAYNLYAEVTFVCPSYWLAEAFTANQSGGYKYQYSPPPALHGSDIGAFYGPQPIYVGSNLFKALQTILINFITTGNPSISSAVANGANSKSTAINPASNWPKFSLQNPQQVNLNETGGVLKSANSFQDVNTTYLAGPGRVNDITLVDAATWEGGRGARCEFLRSIGSMVPE